MIAIDPHHRYYKGAKSCPEYYDCNNCPYKYECDDFVISSGGENSENSC